MGKSSQADYWEECICEAADGCGLSLSQEQRECLAAAAQSAHENYGMAFYSPPASDRISDIESAWKERLRALRAEFDDYRRDAECAVKQALRVHRDDSVTIGPDGEVLRHCGDTERIQ